MSILKNNDAHVDHTIVNDSPCGKKVWLTVVLSFVPGLSFVYLGIWKKAVVLFIIDAGIALTFIFSGSYLAKLLALNIYLVTFMVPALESYQLARYGKKTVDSDARWYVTLLLLTTGFNALPLLWSSRMFSKKAKILWSIAVPLLAAVFVLLLVTYWQRADLFLRGFLEK